MNLGFRKCEKLKRKYVPEETENGVVFRRVRVWDLGLGGFCKKCVFAVVVDVEGRFFYISWGVGFGCWIWAVGYGVIVWSGPFISLFTWLVALCATPFVWLMAAATAHDMNRYNPLYKMIDFCYKLVVANNYSSYFKKNKKLSYYSIF